MEKKHYFYAFLCICLVLLAAFTVKIDKGSKLLESKITTLESRVERFHMERASLHKVYSEQIKSLESKIAIMNKERVSIKYYADGKVKSYDSNKSNSSNISLKDLGVETSGNLTVNKSSIDLSKTESKSSESVVKKEESWYKRGSSLWVVLGVLVTGGAVYKYAK